MSENPSPVINIDDAEEHLHLSGDHWGGSYKVLTPHQREMGRMLGINCTRVPPGRTCVPFHTHAREDEIFYILSGTGVLRYGEALHPLKPGDCVTCPAGTGVAHQMLNTGSEDLIYLAVGNHDPHEVCTYPDSGKVFVRSVGTVGFLEKTEYMAGESDEPKILALAKQAGLGD